MTDYAAGSIPPPPPPPGWPYAGPTAAPAMSIKASARRGVNILAIATLVVGVLPWLGAFAILIGLPALHRMKVTGERGRIVAIIGLTFGCLWALDIVLYEMSRPR